MMPVPGIIGVPNRVPPLPTVTCGAPRLPMVTLVTPLLPRFNRNPLPRLMLLRILNPMVLFLLYAATLSCSHCLYAWIIQGITFISFAMRVSSPSYMFSAVWYSTWLMSIRAASISARCSV
ncbi:hypothetical protein BLIG_01526 [Bifidobacterium longum subsp. infantis CCUG 52486]|uniref:Uncharacterized protein n=1 Tax=Bifidobacterium longum subsp. infantis CCUG 52486 TaxID=537937 RepID=C5ECP4_BIFLI|nr:hypothetical protein BLIG_01526 [Bifidobacterium longum subsp. infantis CCUG 52486]